MRIFSSAYRGLKIGSLFNEKRLLENLGSRHKKLTSWAGGFLKTNYLFAVIGSLNPVSLLNLIKFSNAVL